MAKRDYSEEAYEQIRHTIEQIDNTDVDPVADFFGDLFLRLAQLLKLYSVEQYRNDMQRWYKTVLDSHDATMDKVLSIFRAADDVDFEYRDMMGDAVDSIVSFRNTLNCLRDVISGKTSLADGKAAAATSFAEGSGHLNDFRGAVLTKEQQRVLWDASKELFGDAIKYGSNRTKCMKGGDFADYKNLADISLATACDLLAMAAIVVAPLGAIGDSLDGKMDMTYEEYLDVQFMFYSTAQSLKDVDSVSGLLGNLADDLEEKVAEIPESSPIYPIVKAAADKTRTASNISEGVDILVDLYDIGKDMKDGYETVDGWINGDVKKYSMGEFLEKHEYTPVEDLEITKITDGPDGAFIEVKDTPSAIVKKIFSNWTGLPTSGWNDPSEVDGNVYKTASTVWSYAEKIIPDVDGRSNTYELPDVFLGKAKDTKFLKDVFDLASDIDDFSEKINPNESYGGTGGVKGGRYGWSLG